MTASISEPSPRSLREPPVAPGLAMITDVFQAWRDPLGLMERRVAEYGDVMRMRFAWMGYYVLNDPEAVHHVLVENHRNYQKSRNYRGMKVLLGQGLLTSEGEFWKKQRKLAQPAFHRDSLTKLAGEMVGCTRDMLDRWERELVADRKTFDLHREMMRLTLRIVGKTLFSTDLDGDAKAIGDAMGVAITWANEYVNSVVPLPPWVPSPRNRRFVRAKRTIDELAMRLISERRAAGEVGTDLLGLLMRAEDESSGEKMNDAQLKDELLTLVLAGHETTANALSFAFHLLAHHPEVEAKLLAEIARTIGDRPPALSDLPKMPYTKQVIEESMRLYPPAWVIERESIEEDVVLDYRIRKNHVVAVFPWLLHRHEKYWPNPEKFDPDRFRPELAETRPRHVYMPFGGGPRMCIGNAFAMMEMQLILPMLVRRHRYRETEGFKLALEPTITLRAKHGMSGRLEPRP